MNPIFDRLIRMLKRNRLAEDSFDLPSKTISTAAFPGAEEPEQIHKGKRRLKENYTNHWDMDYLPRQNIDQLYEDE